MVDLSLIQALSLAQAERALNHALAYSVEWPELAKKLNGSVLRCEILPTKQSVYCYFHDNQISLKKHGPDSPNLVISAPLSALLDMLTQKRAGNQIHLTGDAHLAQNLQLAISSLKIDWEALLADQLGDLPARQASQIFTKLKSFGKRFVSRTLSDTTDFLIDETQLLPSLLEFESFSDSVKELRYAVDRFEARLQRLEGKHVQ